MAIWQSDLQLMPKQTTSGNLYVVENDKNVRESIAALFVNRGYIVQSFERCNQFLPLTSIEMSGCVTLDTSVEYGSAGLVGFIELLRERCPLLEIVVFGGFLSEKWAEALTNAGAFRCLEKSSLEIELQETIRLAVEKSELAARTN